MLALGRNGGTWWVVNSHESAHSGREVTLWAPKSSFGIYQEIKQKVTYHLTALL